MSDLVLTGQQATLYRFIRDYTTEHGYPPSRREMRQPLGVTSTSTVAHHLSVLETKGYLQCHPTIPRAITILKQVGDTNE